MRVRGAWVRGRECGVASARVCGAHSARGEGSVSEVGPRRAGVCVSPLPPPTPAPGARGARAPGPRGRGCRGGRCSAQRGGSRAAAGMCRMSFKVSAAGPGGERRAGPCTPGTARAAAAGPEQATWLPGFCGALGGGLAREASLLPTAGVASRAAGLSGGGDRRPDHG